MVWGAAVNPYTLLTMMQMAAATHWADQNVTETNMECEEWLVDTAGDGNTPSQLQWAAQMEVWGNYELGDGDVVHG